MIKQVKVEYFFSFGKTQTVTLSPDTNILIGINGSGKSNFIKIIQLLYEGIVGRDGLENLINKQWGGFTSLINCSDPEIGSIKISYVFDKDIVKSVLNGGGYKFQTDPIYEIILYKLGASNYYFSEKIYNPSLTNERPPFVYLDITNGRGSISTRSQEKNKTKEGEPKRIEIGLKRAVFKENELALRQISEPESFYPLFTLRKAIEEIVFYNYFDTTYNSLIRQLTPYYSDLKLLPNGENLTHLLNYLNGNHTFEYDKIGELLLKVNPNFKGLVFAMPTGGKTLLSLREKNLYRAITVEHISDGTLRFLLLLSILYNPNRGKVVCIDEPEIGLHPDMIQTICEGIKHASETGTQMIIATHSPLLLNAFELEDLLIFEKSENNDTLVKKMSEDDFPDWEGEFLVGQMWLRGQLGGVRW